VAKRNILLVGSVALTDAEAVFATAATLFRGRIKRIPDGGTGARLMWVLWARRVLEGHPAFELDAVEAAAGERLTSAVEGSRKWAGGAGERQGAPPRPRLRLKPGVVAATLGRIGYVEEALASYAVFRRPRERGVIAQGVRFQVALPTTAAFLDAHIAYGDHAAIEPVFRARSWPRSRKSAPRSRMPTSRSSGTSRPRWRSGKACGTRISRRWRRA
jgi:hypothetical protein